MAKKIVLVLVLSFLIGTLPLESWSCNMGSGTPAPDFLVESGNNKKLTLDMVLGRVVVVFYETRDVTGKNSELKSELLKLYQAQPENIKKQFFRLAVVDGSEATLPTISLWKFKLTEHSKKNGFTIYADWHRKMLADYRMKKNDSNFLIIDKQGIIRFAASGKITNGQCEKIKELLCALVQ